MLIELPQSQLEKNQNEVDCFKDLLVLFGLFNISFDAPSNFDKFAYLFLYRFFFIALADRLANRICPILHILFVIF